MLVEGTLRTVGPLASLDWASVMAIDFISCPTKSLLAVIVAPLSLLDLISLLLKFDELGVEFVALVDQLPHLRGEDNIGQVETAVLMVVVKVGVRGGRLCDHIR